MTWKDSSCRTEAPTASWTFRPVFRGTEISYFLGLFRGLAGVSSEMDVGMVFAVWKGLGVKKIRF